MSKVPTYSKVLVFLSTLLLFACSGGESGRSSSASKVSQETQANVFQNEYFGLSATKPEEWHSLTYKQMQTLLGVGGDVAASGNEDMKRVLEASQKRSHPIFAFFMHELGSPVPLNPNVIAIAEDIGFLSGVKSGKDFFFHAKNLMTQSGMDYSFGESYSQRTIGGVVFDAMDVTLNFNGQSIKQTYYAAPHRNYIISFIESYGTDDLKGETSAILDSVTLKW